MNEKQEQLLDTIEAALVRSILALMRPSMPNITEVEARNLLGKIGARITFGTEVWNEAFNKGKKGEKQNVQKT